MTDSNKKPKYDAKKRDKELRDMVGVGKPKSTPQPKVGSKWRLKKKLTVKTRKKPKDPGSGYTIRRVPKTRKKPTSFWV